MSDQQEIPVRATSAYGAHSRTPYVQLVIGDTMYSWPATRAKEIGAMLIEVAFAAEGDGFVFDFVSKTLGAGDERAGMILVEFRQWRKQKEQEAP